MAKKSSGLEKGVFAVALILAVILPIISTIAGISPLGQAMITGILFLLGVVAVVAIKSKSVAKFLSGSLVPFGVMSIIFFVGAVSLAAIPIVGTIVPAIVFGYTAMLIGAAFTSGFMGQLGMLR